MRADRHPVGYSIAAVVSGFFATREEGLERGLP